MNMMKNVNRNNQKGVVLVISLVFLVALTSVAAALMQNTSTDMKMSGASQDKATALQEAISSMDQVIYNQVNQVNGQNYFVANANQFNSGLLLKLDPNSTTYDFPVLNVAVALPEKTSATIALANTQLLEVDCPHSLTASSVQVFKCNVLRVQLNRLYGRNDANTIQVNTGISQQLLNVGN